MKVYFRKAKKSDCDILFKWANDPLVRKNAFNTKPITYKEHLVWFNKNITDPNAKIFILELNKQRKPVGQIRFNRVNDNKYLIDINISPDYRSKGIGAEGLKRCSAYMFTRHKADSLTAEIKNINTNSIECFKKAGFNIIRQVQNVTTLTIELCETNRNNSFSISDATSVPAVPITNAKLNNTKRNISL